MKTGSGWAALAAATVMLGSVSSAWALDGYRDRKGLLYGLTVGFGGSKPGDADREMGVDVRGRVGGGPAANITLDAELGYDRLIDVDASSITGYAGVNFFLIDNLYLRGMGGIAHFSPDEGKSETGLGVGGGVGYEFFVNSDLAIGGLLDYQKQFYKEFDVDTFSFGVTLSMY
jgi:hypothetical protein